MSKAGFAYVIYVRATREEIWNGLVDPEMPSLLVPRYRSVT
jgi:hypothetical protein